MSQEAAGKYGPTAKPGATVIVDSDLVTADIEGANVHGAPFTRIAEELGNRIVANIVMLGFLTALTGLVERDAMEEAIRTEVKARFVDLNLEAFGRGYERARETEAVR
jgi:2-oxoglutarate ferredoxin oxidoreductase subunit gamma